VGLLIELAIAAAIAAAVSLGTWNLATDHYLAIAQAKQLETDKRVAAANQKAENAAIDWQAWAEVQPAKIVYRDRKVQDAFKAAPEWAATPLPDGVRNQLAAAAPGADPDSAEGAMPAASAASAADQPGSGTGLSRLTRFFRVVPASAPSTGAGDRP
jgi:hypothetical protein